MRRLLFLLMGLVVLGLPAGASAAEGGCANEAARVGLAQRLPDCRAYELVSPGNTASGDVRLAQASVGDGDHAWFSGGLGAVDGGQGTGWPTPAAAQRDATGWHAAPLAASPDLFTSFYAASEDGAQSLVFTGRSLGIGSFAGDQFFETIDAGGRRTVSLVAHRPQTAFYPEPRFVGSSSDLSRVFITDSVSPLSEQAVGGPAQLFEGHEGQVQMIGVDEAGQSTSCESSLAGGRNSERGRGQGGLSTDGRTVFYMLQSSENGSCGVSDLYVRLEGHSTNISKPGNGASDLGATYLGNDRSGSVVYFMTASQLVVEDNDSEVDIYRYEVASGHLALITHGAGIVSAAVSLDGSHVYFVARNPIEGQGTAGMDNLFAWSSGSVSYVATGITGSIALGGSQFEEGVDQSPITPDGRVLLFFSTASLTGYNNTDAITGLPDDELFRYVASDGQLSCISCNPSGVQPIGGYQSLGNAYQNEPAPRYNAFFHDYYTSSINGRYISDDGEFAFFTSQDALVPQDTNGGRDVYEWHAGKLSLLTSGMAEELRSNSFGASTEMIGASASGRDVVFISPARLNSEADQSYVKLWDARIDGGFAPAAVAPPCEGEGCRTADGGAPVFAPPASSVFAGTGNAAVAAAPAVHKAPRVTIKRRARRKVKKSKHGRRSVRRSLRANKSVGRGRR